MIDKFPLEAELLDRRVLNLLVRRAAHAEGNGHRWFGLRTKHVCKAMGLEQTKGNINRVRCVLETLERGGKAYPIRWGKYPRWFPSSHEVVRDALGQTELESYT